MPKFNPNFTTAASRFNKDKNFRAVMFADKVPVLGSEENEVQDIQNHLRSEIVRNTVHSGVLQSKGVFSSADDSRLGDISLRPTVPNSFCVGRFTAVINGELIDVKGWNNGSNIYNVINLSEPPTEDFVSATGKKGEREDLVFLEAWYEEITATGDNSIIDPSVGEETSRRKKLNWRIRVVDDVEFPSSSKYGYLESIVGWASGTVYSRIRPQGGNGAPLTNTISNFNQGIFRPCLGDKLKNWYNNYGGKDDIGLWLSGDGTQSSKDLLKTADGFVYAIPLFRIKRRNSGDYSVTNANGAKKLTKLTFTSKDLGRLYPYQTIVNWNSFTDTSKVEPGDLICWTTPNAIAKKTGYYFKVIEVVDNTTLKVMYLSGSSNYYVEGIWGDYGTVYIVPKDPNYLFSDIIDERDIIDLRHEVSLTGYDLTYVLNSNLRKAYRGELRKKKMVKTYHGIPKTPIDANTVFYASLDGVTTPEVGTLVEVTATKFNQSPTGLGLKFENAQRMKVTAQTLTELTIDLTVAGDDLNKTTTYGQYICALFGGDGQPKIGLIKNANGTSVSFALNSPTQNAVTVDTSVLKGKKTVHFRMTYKNGVGKLYANGKELSSLSRVTDFTNVSFEVSNVSSGYGFTGVISDVMLSNIDRGDVFQTLPKDFIDGYALIMPAMSNQRKTYSDVATCQNTSVIVPHLHSKWTNIGATSSIKVIRNPEVTSSSKTVDGWSVNDTIKIKGLAGEVISGVLDGDSAIARVISNAIGSNSCVLDDVSKIKIGDTYRWVRNDGYIGDQCTVTAIDVTSKTIWFSGADPGSLANFLMLVENTISTCQPVVRSMVRFTPQAGGASTITLPSSFLGTDSAYNGHLIEIVSGTGAGQQRIVTGFVGATKVATVNIPWTTIPDTTSKTLMRSWSMTVPGTWTGLGTNEATFTIGTIAGIAGYDDGKFDIMIDYGLYSLPGQGCIPESCTNILAGEVKGKRSIIGKLAVIDDFAGKIVGSTIVNPNVAKYREASNELLSPYHSNWVELTQPRYDSIKNLDGNTQPATTSVNGIIPQQMFSFDLIRIVEDKFGPIQALDKVDWLRNNFDQYVNFNWYGYGVCPIGNKVRIALWDLQTGWSPRDTSNEMHTNNVVTKLCYTMNWISPSRFIDANGFAHLIAYTDASNGTISSTVYTDYVNLEVNLKIPTGYTALSPENPRRDDGVSNVLLVRKETKELRTFFDAVNTDGIVTYSEVLDSYEKLTADTNVTIVSQKPYFLATDLNSKVGDKYNVHPYNLLADLFGLNEGYVFGEYGYVNVPLSSDSLDQNTGVCVTAKDVISSGYTRQVSLKGSKRPMYYLMALLVIHESELKLLVVTTYSKDGKVYLGGTNGEYYKSFLIPVEGRLLTKLEEGAVVSTMTGLREWLYYAGELFAGDNGGIL